MKKADSKYINPNLKQLNYDSFALCVLDFNGYKDESLVGLLFFEHCEMSPFAT